MLLSTKTRYRFASQQYQKAGTSLLPGLFALSDPVRQPDLLKLANSLPAGSALIYRHFGELGRFKKAVMAAQLCQTRKVLFLVSYDPQLAIEAGADGMHFPGRFQPLLPRYRRKQPLAFCSGSAHSARKGRLAIQNGADAVLLSPVFASQSPSAGRALGVCRFASMVRQIPGPVYALGGITPANATRVQSHCAGVAMVSGTREPA